MSEIKKIDVNQVEQIIDNLLKQDTKISVEYVDTYYIYGSDKKLLLTLTREAGNDEELYNTALSNAGITAKLKLDQDIHKQLYEYASSKYSYEPIPYEKTFESITGIDVKKMWNESRAYTSMKNREKFLYELITLLMKHRMPVGEIKRVFYYFDKQKTQNRDNKIPEQFKMLNHDAKLVEYNAPRGNHCFFTDEKRTSGFMQVNENSEKIFDKVKIALQNQRQNVK